MVDFQPYPASMPHDFELYSSHEQQFDFVPTSQPFLPSHPYGIEASFSVPFDSVVMPAMSEAPRPQELQSYYDGIAQGVKPSFQYTPHGSPNSASHSFEHPPILSASSESDASVSSSNMGSPSLNPQFEAWNPMTNGLGIPLMQNTSSFDYEGLVVADKAPGCVGESTILSRLDSSTFVSSCHETPPSLWSEIPRHNAFKSPVTPASASAKWSNPRSATASRRRGSLLSQEVQPKDIPGSCSELSPSTPVDQSPSLSQSPFHINCRFPSSPQFTSSFG
jgi:hypothetical protein